MTPETSVTIPVNPLLLSEARETGVDLTELLERALLRRLSTPEAERIKAESARLWREENADAIRASNSFIEEHGLWCDTKSV